MTPTKSQLNAREVRAIDLFCGAGGCSLGARLAGVTIVAGFDKWELAGRVYKDNFPNAKFYCNDLKHLKPTRLKSELGKVDLIIASPECTNHSVARGKLKRSERRISEQSKETVFHVLRFAYVLRPRWILIENVTRFRKWKRYKEVLTRLRSMGYFVQVQAIDASKFGVPQSRKRLYILCDDQQQPQKVQPPAAAKKVPARSVIDLNGTYKVTPLKKPKRAKATLQRARRAIRHLGPDKPFLIVYYGSDKGGGWQRLNVPLRTVTTLDRFALVKPGKSGHVMRMLQVPELQRAMGFGSDFVMKHGNRRQKIHMLGNAVCPPVIQAIVRTLITDSSASGQTGKSGRRSKR